MKPVHYDVVITTPLPRNWRIGLTFNDAVLVGSAYLPPTERPRGQHLPVASRVIQRMEVFFESANEAIHYDLTIPGGTPFQQRVWQALLDIPLGQTLSYGQLAKQLHSSPRAVAGACRRNHLPFFIPCHRVVAGNGIGGFMGHTDGDPIAIKQWLLRHEHGE